jgi:hypothetical protein
MLLFELKALKPFTRDREKLLDILERLDLPLRVLRAPCCTQHKQIFPAKTLLKHGSICSKL